MDLHFSLFKSLKNKIVANFDRTSIELEKKANILLFSTCLSIFFIFLLFFATLNLPTLTRVQKILFTIIEICAFANYLGVIGALGRGKYNIASQMFLWGNMLLGFISSFVRRNGTVLDLYFLLVIIAFIILIAVLVSVKVYQVVQVLIVGYSVLIALFVTSLIWSEGVSKDSQSLIHFFIVFIFAGFIGALGILLFRFSKESIMIAQKESNNNMIKLSQLKMISNQLPRDLEKLAAILMNFSIHSSQSSKVIVSRFAGLEVALEQISLEISQIFADHPELMEEYNKKQLFFSENSQVVFDSITLIKELTDKSLKLSLDIEKLSKDSNEYVTQFKKDLSQF